MAIVINASIVNNVVLAVARRHPWVDIDDLRQEAAIAVMFALDRYDPDKSANITSYVRTVVASRCRNYAWQFYGPTAAPNNGTRQSHVTRIKAFSLQHAAECGDDDNHNNYNGILEEASVRDCTGEEVITCVQDKALAHTRARNAIRFALLQLGEHAELIAAVLTGELSAAKAAKLYGIPSRRVNELVAQARSVFQESEDCRAAFEDLT